jgi:superfamily I DNA/RNA helicase
MSFITAETWIPVGIDSLEPIANLVVRSERNTLVVAGPGAGKTELLAQRACFLLETGKCAHPRRILTISFKRDAAKNLRTGVEKRSG